MTHTTIKTSVILSIFCLISSFSFSQNDTLWFDYDWDITTKNYADFYRLPTERKGELFHIQDYYISGAKQMEGYTYTSAEPFHLEGMAIWYYESGAKENQVSYIDNEVQLSESYFENGAVQNIVEYTDGIPSKYVAYDYEVDYNSGDFELVSNEPYYVIEMKDGLFHGEVYEVDYTSRDTVYSGFFENGIMQRFVYYNYDGYDKYNISEWEGVDSKKAQIIAEKDNVPDYELHDYIFPITKKIGKLKDGIEIWEQYVGDDLYVKQFYKNGIPYGNWEAYNLFSGEISTVIPYGEYCTQSSDYKQVPMDLDEYFPNYYLYTGYIVIDECLHGVYKSYEDGAEIVKGNYFKGEKGDNWTFKYEFDKEYFDPSPNVSVGFDNYNYVYYFEEHLDYHEDNYDYIIDAFEEEPLVSENDIFTVVEDMPIFNYKECKKMEDKSAKQTCSQEQLLHYLSEIKYPDFARDNDIEGKVFVKFIIDIEGKVKGAEILKGADIVLNEAALDHIQKMPNWEPGYQRGEPVNVQYAVPISFKLADEEPIIEED